MDEKDRVTPAEVDAEGSEEDTGADRVFNLDSEASEPVPPDDDAAAQEPEAPPAHGKRGKISRRDFLDRFQEKNIAITRLTKEKAALEKSRAAAETQKATLEREVSDLKDKWLRSVAEFENYRKRSAKEWELLKQQSKSEVILEVLNSLDDFERAFAAIENRDPDEFVEGIRLIYNNLVQALDKMGVIEIDALRQSFDPTRHMAIGQIETTDVASGHVAQVVQKGYSFNGIVIRPARVIVAK